MIQMITSSDTSVNVRNAIFRMLNLPEGAKILDYGCGRFNTNKEFCEQLGYIFKGYDPYNQALEDNIEALEFADEGVDVITCNNVLNVIKEDKFLEDVLQHINNLADDDTNIFFTIYEGDKGGVGTETTKGYQRNQRTRNYLPMIEKCFVVLKVRKNIVRCVAIKT